MALSKRSDKEIVYARKKHPAYISIPASAARQSITAVTNASREYPIEVKVRLLPSIVKVDSGVRGSVHAARVRLRADILGRYRIRVNVR